MIVWVAERLNFRPALNSTLSEEQKKGIFNTSFFCAPRNRERENRAWEPYMQHSTSPIIAAFQRQSKKTLSPANTAAASDELFPYPADEETNIPSVGRTQRNFVFRFRTKVSLAQWMISEAGRSATDEHICAKIIRQFPQHFPGTSSKKELLPLSSWERRDSGWTGYRWAPVFPFVVLDFMRTWPLSIQIHHQVPKQFW